VDFLLKQCLSDVQDLNFRILQHFVLEKLEISKADCQGIFLFFKLSYVLLPDKFHFDYRNLIHNRKKSAEFIKKNLEGRKVFKKLLKSKSSLKSIFE